jgi:hypothetical protein
MPAIRSLVRPAYEELVLVKLPMFQSMDVDMHDKR